MKFRNLLLLLVITASQLSLFSAEVSKNEAERIATKFYNRKFEVNHPGSKASFHVIETIVIQHDNAPAIYVMNFNNGGHAVVPADDRLYPVLGFSFESSYNPSIAPDNWKYVLNNFAAQVTHVRKNNVDAAPEASYSWAQLRDDVQGDLSFLENIRDIPPMLTCTWNQDFPYNYLCPPDPQGPGGYVYAGCVATAMAMIMYHWRFPYTGQGSKTYYAGTYGAQTANFGNTYYDYEGMVNNVGTTPNYPVALLQYHCGVSVSMQYGPNGSGAYSTDVAPAIKNYFKYSYTAQYVQRGSWVVWKAYLDQQMELLQPVYYSGTDSQGGHAFVVDGMQQQGNETYYHFNFGWGGSGNGWYLVTDAGGFNSNNAMVRNFIPSETMYPYPHPTQLVTVSHLVGTIEDASGPKHNYQPNVNSRWLISPQTAIDSVSYIKLKFDRFATQEGFDFVRIYDGDNESAPLLGEFSGTTLPPEIVSTGNKVLIVFTTDSSIEDNGWLLSYRSVQPVWCSGLVNLTAPSGTFNDGSGPFYYNNGTVCMWTIQPQWATTTTIYFNYFETEAGKDFLKVYNMANQQLLANLSGNTLPNPITSPSGKFYLVFTTNNMNRAQGWEIFYSANNVGISENDEVFTNLNIYPNPARDQLNVNFISPDLENATISLFNPTGVKVYEQHLYPAYNVFASRINLTGIPRGIYILRIQSDKKELVRKIIVE